MRRPDFSTLRFRAERLAEEADVQNLVDQAMADPERFTRSVQRSTFLAYAYVAFVILGLTAAVGGGMVLIQYRPLIGVLIVFLAGGALFAFVRSLNLGIEPITALQADLREAPQLETEIKRFAKMYDLPPICKVFVDYSTDAGVVTETRPGFWGGSNTSLLLGYFTLRQLSPAEFRALMAHEMAHYVGGHGRVSLAAANLSERLRGMQDNMMEREQGTWLIFPFLRWFYNPYQKRVFALKRVHEVEADRLAAKAIGAEESANMLARLILIEHQRQNLQNEEAEKGPPTLEAYIRIEEGLGLDKMPRDELADLLKKELDVPAHVRGVHPPLTERWKIMGVDPADFEKRLDALAKPIGESALQHYFGVHAEAFTSRVRRDFMTRNADQIEEYTQDQRKMNEALEDFRRRPVEQLSAQEWFQYLGLEGGRGNCETAIALSDQALRRFPNDASLWFAAGQLRLRHGDPDAERYLTKSIELDPNMEGVITHFRLQNAQEQNDTASARELEQLAMDLEARELAIDREMSQMSPNSAIEPWVLAPEDREALARVLVALREVDSAYTVICRPRSAPDLGQETLLAFASGYGRVVAQQGTDIVTLVSRKVPDSIPVRWVRFVEGPRWKKRLGELSDAKVK